MPKRQKLNFDNQQLTQNLKASKGRGMDALFPPVSSPEKAETIEKTRPSEGHGKQTLPESYPPLRKQTKPGIDRKLTENGGQTGDVASKLASTIVQIPEEIIESIRQGVKKTGKEVTFVRVTPAEKMLLADVVHASKRHRRTTTENEVARIAITYLLLDYQNNLEDSLLISVLRALES